MENRREKIDFQNKNILPPNGESKVLLHCCCAPCTGEMIETLTKHGIDLTVFFYNPNIHPKSEYEKRKKEIVNFSGKMNIPCIDGDYDQDHWFKRVQGLEEEPEKGQRCSVCFDMRLERAALFARENSFKIFTSSFGVSRWKDMDQVNTSGMRAATRYPNLVYWTYNWRKLSGSKRMYEIAKEEQFYRQDYCGCVYSMRKADSQQALPSQSADRLTQK